MAKKTNPQESLAIEFYRWLKKERWNNGMKSKEVISFTNIHKMFMGQRNQSQDKLHENLVDALATIKEYHYDQLLPIIKASIDTLLEEAKK